VKNWVNLLPGVCGFLLSIIASDWVDEVELVRNGAGRTTGLTPILSSSSSCVIMFSGVASALEGH